MPLGATASVMPKDVAQNAKKTEATDKASCKHCGTTYQPKREDDLFCCAGCEYVYRMIGKEGFEQYYALRDRSISPVQSTVFQERDYAWFNERIQTAEQAVDATGMNKPAEASFDLQGISCVGCVWLIEQVLNRMEGVRRVDIDAGAGTLRLSWTAGAELRNVPGELQRFGYVLGPLSSRKRCESRGVLARLGICGAFAMNAMAFTLPTYLGMEEGFSLAPHFRWLTFFFATMSFAVGGSYFIKRAWQALQQRTIHIDLPIALGVTLAYIGSIIGMILGEHSLFYFDFVAIFTFLMLAGRWTQVAALERNRNRLLGDSDIVRTVTRQRDGMEISLEELNIGDNFALERGRFLPVAARLSEADAVFSLESINGEAEPQSYKVGQDVPAGAIYLGQQGLVLEAIETWQDSLLRKLVESSGQDKRKSAQWVERFLRIYLLVIITTAFAGSSAWLISGSWVSALQVGISILVVSCPCALGVAIPLLDELSIANLRRSGVFLREVSWWSRMCNLKQIFFDKTGTLTEAIPQMLNPEAIQTLDAEARQMLFELVAYNRHPAAKALRQHLLDCDSDLANINEVAGMGVYLEAEANTWSLGRPGWTPQSTTKLGTQPSNANDCEFCKDGTVLASFRFQDAVREDAVQCVETLKQHGLSIGILSGDKQEKVETIAKQLQLDAKHCRGGLTPEQKAGWIEVNQAGSTLFIGDGINDSLAFDAAASSGTPVIDQGVLESKADFYYTGRGLAGICELWRTAILRSQTLHQVIGFTLIYNSAAIIICLSGKMNPLLAAILMPLSSLISIFIVNQNGRRMKRI